MAFRCPYSVSSTYARLNATGIAAAASLGLISTRGISPFEMTRFWRITSSGLDYLRDYHPAEPA